ncbi:MaoC family dehydratase [Salinisphaera orenii]|uniref:Acyl dehydratase n=1 Tax=Salinisphaera orenii YIM 95161 TaxID=1051139 RepID=A0A423Q3Q4_9GAMM|nr:MaoC family dehydratase [Salinisphaera halophila]ROO33654.1 acyl dehydratase [Salinisphaera halophila YIM 95161]
MIHYEDMQPGDVADLGPTEAITAEAIVAFAERYDPQPFHLSDAGAADTYFETLAASGWHTAALTMKLLMTGRDEPLASLGSPGFDDLRWHRPVHVGDRLSVRCTVTDKRVSKSRPEMGLVHFAVETRNQDEVTVMSYRTVSMLARREAG